MRYLAAQKMKLYAPDDLDESAIDKATGLYEQIMEAAEKELQDRLLASTGTLCDMSSITVRLEH